MIRVGGSGSHYYIDGTVCKSGVIPATISNPLTAMIYCKEKAMKSDG